MASRELKNTRPGRYVCDTIDGSYKKHKKELITSGKLDELIEEAIDIEDSIMGIAKKEFLEKNPQPHSEQTYREYTTMLSATREVVNHELAELVEAEMNELTGKNKEFDIDDYLQSLK